MTVSAKNAVCDAVTDGAEEEIRFFADVMLGRLARWLRILGYDTRYERGIGDDELLRQAAAEDRLVLTRDTRLMSTAGGSPARLLFLESEKPREQLCQLRDRFGVRLDRRRLFTRCSWCNTLLEDAPKETVEGKVPPYVFATEEQFLRCPVCDKFYWRGTHQDRFLAQLFGER